MLSPRIIIALALTLGFLSCQSRSTTSREIVRPEKIRSWREVYYDQDAYKKLEALWKQYYDAYPSEDAYANWMYAARYAQDGNYEKLLGEGLKKYPDNPTLLYLTAGTKHTVEGWTEARRYLERSAELDPSYNDPWFSLVVNFMQEGNEERSDDALRHLLQNGAVSDEVMDYSYNTLLTLEPNAILVTNGDNDTYPAWILTRIVKFRPDVTIVNRSLMNTEWYPERVMQAGVPIFATKDQLDSLWKNTKPPWSDTLIVRLVSTAKKARRPVYFALTLYSSPSLDRLKDAGRFSGLATLVTPPEDSYADDLRRTTNIWLKDFRTGGLDSWQLRNARSGNAGRMLVPNYAAVLAREADSLKEDAPELLPPVFNWYVSHIEPLLDVTLSTNMAQMWCQVVHTPEAIDWCRRKGL